MSRDHQPPSPADVRRREFLRRLGLGAGAFVVPSLLPRTAFGERLFTEPGLFAEELDRTPPQGEGPFYPDKLPLDTDNDLLRINKEATPALGEVCHLFGRVLDSRGEPVRNALIEIWQCDQRGNYIHSRGGTKGKRDGNFQGFGRFLTGIKGEYYFRTIKPVPYVGRTPHIHVAVLRGDQRILTTQLYDRARRKENEKDGLFRREKSAKLRELLMTDFVALKGSKVGELQAEWNIVIGHTPVDREEPPKKTSTGRILEI